MEEKGFLLDSPFTPLFLLSVDISRILFSIICTILIARIFGASSLTDAFFIAQAFTLMLGERIRRSINLTFVPVYTEYRINRTPLDLSQMTNTYARRIFIYSFLGVGLYIILSPLWLRLIGYGFNNEIIAKATKMVWLFAPTLLLCPLFSISESIFLSHREFKIPSFASLLVVLGTFVGIISLSKYMGIYGIALGTTIGMFLAFIIPYLLLRQRNFHYSLNFLAKEKASTHAVTNNTLPVLLYGIVFQIIISTDRIFATTLSAGMASALSYALNLSIVVPILISSSLLVASLPKLSGFIAKRDFSSVSTIFHQSFKLISFIIFPFAFLLFLLGDQVIRFLLHGGSFTTEATENTAIALKYYAIGVPFHGLWVFIVGIYIAMGRNNFLILISFLLLAIAIILDYIFMKEFGYIGLPIATSILFFLHFFIFFVMLKRDFSIGIKETTSYLTKVIISSSFMAGFIWIIKNQLFKRLWKDLAFFPEIMMLLSITFFGMLLYMSVSRWMKIVPIEFNFNSIRRKPLEPL